MEVEVSEDLQQCEVFLRAILSLKGEECSILMWEQCRRHEWHEWEWNTKEGEIQLRNAISTSPGSNPTSDR